MKKFLCLLNLLFIFYSTIAQIQKLETEHFKAKFDIEIEDYALAGLMVLEEAWTIATNNGFYLPERLISPLSHLKEMHCTLTGKISGKLHGSMKRRMISCLPIRAGRIMSTGFVMK